MKFKVIADIIIEVEDLDELYKSFKRSYPEFTIQTVREIKENQ